MNLKEIRLAALEAKAGIFASATRYGRAPKIYLHWTAGNYNQTFDEYHLCILGDGSVRQTRPLSEIPAATYQRNSGSIAIALCCAVNATPKNLGSCPPTDAQIECAAQIVAVLADALGIPIDLDHVMTHAEAADNLDGYEASEPYGPANGCERWDLAILCDEDDWMAGGFIIRGKAKYYQEQGV